jgi:hypothetical protein
MAEDGSAISPELRSDNPRWWVAPWEFAVHGIVGTSIFSIIAAVAILLDLALRRLDGYGVSGVIMFGLKSAEYGLFGTDLVLFAVFLWRTASRVYSKL